MREPPFFAVTPPLNRRYIAVTPLQMREPPFFAVFNVDVTQMEMQRTLYVYVTPADAVFEPPGPSRAELTDHPNFAGIGAIFFIDRPDGCRNCVATPQLTVQVRPRPSCHGTPHRP